MIARFYSNICINVIRNPKNIREYIATTTFLYAYVEDEHKTKVIPSCPIIKCTNIFMLQKKAT